MTTMTAVKDTKSECARLTAADGVRVELVSVVDEAGGSEPTVVDGLISEAVSEVGA